MSSYLVQFGQSLNCTFIDFPYLCLRAVNALTRQWIRWHICVLNKYQNVCASLEAPLICTTQIKHLRIYTYFSNDANCLEKKLDKTAKNNLETLHYYFRELFL